MQSVHDVPASGTEFNKANAGVIAKGTAFSIKASPGNLYRCYVTNDNAAAQAYAWVDKASAPATNDVPLSYFYVPAKTTMLIEYKFGKRFAVGIALAQVTTIGAATITTTTWDTLIDPEFG